MSETPNSPSGDAAGEPVDETSTGADVPADSAVDEQDHAAPMTDAVDTDDEAAFAASIADEIAAANAGVVPAAAPMPPAAPASVVAADNVDAARAAAEATNTDDTAADAEAARADSSDAGSSDAASPVVVTTSSLDASHAASDAEDRPASREEGSSADIAPTDFADEDAPAVTDPDAPADASSSTSWNAAAKAASESARAAEAAADAAVAGSAASAADESASDIDRARAAAAAMADDDDTPWYDRPEVAEAAASLPTAVTDARTTALTPPAAETVASETVVADAVAADAAPVAPAPTGVTAGPAQIFVQAPDEPTKRGNRAFSGVVGLLATVVFAVLYMAATLLPRGGEVLTSFDALGSAALTQATSPAFWIPVGTFFLSFWLLGAILNTAKWGYWVVFGLLVGVLTLGGHVLGQIIGANPWLLTPTQALELARTSVFSVPGLVAFVIGRELPIWFGGWIARRGRKVIAANAEAQEEFQRILDAGPQLAG